MFFVPLSFLFSPVCISKCLQAVFLSSPWIYCILIVVDPTSTPG